MTVTRVNEFHERYSEAIAAELARVRPGEVIAPDVEVSMHALFEAASGLTRDQYLSNPYGFPMMPIPLAGRQRLPRNVSFSFMGHPAFWLDERVGERRPDEPEEHWAVRLYMELVIRGWWSVSEGEWYDLFQVAGFDQASSSFRRRLEAYRDGQPDADLYELIIPEIVEGVTDLGGPAAFADEICATLEPVLVEMTALAAAEVRAVSDKARLLLVSDFMRMSKPLVSALTAYRAVAPQGEAWVSVWQSVSEAAYSLRDKIDEIFRSEIDAIGPVVRASALDTDDFLDGVYRLSSDLQDRENDRHRQFDALMMALREHGSDDASFKALFGFLRESHRSAVARLRTAFGKVDAINASGDWHPPAEMESDAEDAGAIVMPAEEGSAGRELPMLRPAPLSRTNGARPRPQSAADMFGLSDEGA